MMSMGKAAREAARVLALASDTVKSSTLHIIAKNIREQQSFILEQNQRDIVEAKQKNISAALLDRLLLNTNRIEAMANSLETIAQLPDPVGKILAEIQRPNGLKITRVSVPLGVIGVIYESRPNVTIDAAGLCLKSGNAVILRGGSESFHSSMALMQAIQQGLTESQLPMQSVQMVATRDRAAVSEMLKMDRYIDVIIPRGGQPLIDAITAESRIPLFKHLAGLCHTYIHRAADKSIAKKIVLNAKMRRTGICGATEVLLVDETILHSHLPEIIESLLQAGCEIRGDVIIQALDPRIKLAGEKDFDTEFLDAIIAVRFVKNIDEAIQHIRQHGTQHTEAIITEDVSAAEKFFREVDSAIVMHNTSTQFADGGEFGMGAEIGIATGKLHARGPIGVEQLTTFKYLVQGSGQVRV